jgi:hypothetical protein
MTYTPQETKRMAMVIDSVTGALEASGHPVGTVRAELDETRDGKAVTIKIMFSGQQTGQIVEQRRKALGIKDDQ